MRRLLSILLLATFALPLVAPALALGQDPDAGLPACCRRHGKHHCAMLDRKQDPSAHSVGAVCPFFPQHPAAFLSGPHAPALQSRQPVEVFFVTSTARAPLQTHRLIERSRSHSERGPPLQSLAIS